MEHDKGFKSQAGSAGEPAVCRCFKANRHKLSRVCFADRSTRVIVIVTAGRSVCLGWVGSHSSLAMSSFHPPSPSPPLPPLPAHPSSPHSLDRLRTVAADCLTWCIGRYASILRERQDEDTGLRDLALRGVAASIVGLAALGLVLALPVGGKAIVVNGCGFVFPALATAREVDEATKHGRNLSSAQSGYWVRPIRSMSVCTPPVVGFSKNITLPPRTSKWNLRLHVKRTNPPLVELLSCANHRSARFSIIGVYV